MSIRIPFFRSFSYGLACSAIAAALLLTGCDSLQGMQDETPDATENAALVAGLAQDLSLSTTLTNDLQATYGGPEHEGGEPGRLWRFAAELQQKLTDEQKARLFALLDQRPGFDGKHRPGPKFHWGKRLEKLLDLTEAQQEALRTIRTRYAESFRTLAQQRRDGEISDEAFKAQMASLRTQMQTEVDGVLTDEQKARAQELREKIEERFGEWREHRAEHREAARLVMVEVLGLTPAQQAALEALREEALAARQALLDQVRDGSLDRDGLTEALQALHEANEAERAAILTPTQLEIVKIHHALTLRVLHARAKHRRGPHNQG